MPFAYVVSSCYPEEACGVDSLNFCFTHNWLLANRFLVLVNSSRSSDFQSLVKVKKVLSLLGIKSNRAINDVESK